MKYLANSLVLLLCLTLIFSVAGCSIGSGDTSAPSTPQYVKRATPCNDNTPTFSWSEATDSDSGVDYYLVSVDSGEWEDVGDVNSYSLDTPLEDRSHTFAVKAVDNAANVGAVHSIGFTLDTTDTTQPSISSVSASVISSSRATITWTTDKPSIPQVEYGTTNGYGLFQPASPFVQTVYRLSHSITLTDLTPDMTYHYRVRAIDTCGNKTVSDDYTLVIYGAAPVITKVTSSGFSETSATITWTTDGVSTSQVEYGTTTGYGSTSALDTTLVKNHSVSVSGLSAATTYHFIVKPQDSSGNEAVSGDYSFTSPGT